MQLPQLVEVGVAERFPDAGLEHLQHQHHQQHVQGDAELDDQPTPAVVRNPTAVMPLSISRKPTSWDSANRRVTSTKKPISTTAIATGMACVAGDGSSATSGRDTGRRAGSARPRPAGRPPH